MYMIEEENWGFTHNSRLDVNVTVFDKSDPE